MSRLLNILSIILFVALLTPSSGYSLDGQAQTFREVKQQAKAIWQDHRITFYCGCTFNKQMSVNHASCGYQPLDRQRAKRVEWEHLVPVSWFGHQRPCWREPLCKNKKGKYYYGRDCCEKIDPEFRKMYFDLHNLVPAIGEVNKARQNYRFVDLHLQKKYFQGCELYINDDLRIVVPKDKLKGVIARAHLYMAKQYGFKLSRAQRTLFKKWHRQYPPSNWEKQWNQRVRIVQGTDNTYISRF